MPAERAILVTIQLDPRFTKNRLRWKSEDEAAELKDLALSAGTNIVAEVTANRHQPVAATFLGSGKLEELAALAAQHRAQVVIFNQEFSPAQQRNIEEAVKVKTIDRTQLILDIFAQRAKSQEGKIQVEMAQMRYLMPRLVGEGLMLSRTGGGIGTRGPGEQKLEIDRRRIRQRIGRLEDELEKIGKRRMSVRQTRKETQVPVAALVGYTNAGKSTLLKTLTGQDAVAKDQLFTTLDPLARRMQLPNGQPLIVTDTVGFLHHLPHHLVEAFQATLEEANEADVLLHVLDVSHPLISEHANAVEDVLKKLELRDKPTITALNKIDLLDDPGRATALERAYPLATAISARTGEGLPRLKESILLQLEAVMAEPTTLRIPAEQTEVISSLYQNAHVLSRRPDDGAVLLTVRLPSSLSAKFAPYIHS